MFHQQCSWEIPVSLIKGATLNDSVKDDQGDISKSLLRTQLQQKHVQLHHRSYKLCLYDRKSPVGWCCRCQHFCTEIAAGLTHLFCSLIGALISVGRMFHGKSSHGNGSDCKVKEWNTFAWEPHIRSALHSNATVALLFLYSLWVLISHAFGSTWGALVVSCSKGTYKMYTSLCIILFT